MSSDEPPPPRRSELSKAPSWLMLGFALGALCVLMWPRESEAEASTSNAVAPAVAPPPPPAASLTVRPGEPSLSAIEAVFAEWGRHAVWDGEVTQVALWNTRTRSYADCFEVVRRGDEYYYRALPRLTWRPVDRGLGVGAPLQFTLPPQQTER